jgi:magnesium transporter
MGRKRKKKTGLPPGSMVFLGDKNTEHINVTLMRYNQEEVFIKKYENELPTITDMSSDNTVTWYDLKGLSNLVLMEQIGKAFQVHPLVLEDIVAVGQRPKFEEYETGIFLVAHAYKFNETTLTLQAEQISFYIGQNFLITFQEDSEELFLPICNLIEAAKDKIRHRKSDYLAYILLDYIVDQYLEILDTLEEKIEHYETAVLSQPSPHHKSIIYSLKREISAFKRNTLSLREAIQKWILFDGDFLQETTKIYLRDLLDHTNRVMERSESAREQLTELQGLYLSGLSAKVNNVINILTMISTIFIPLTFIVGVYGMNFDNMPELHHPYGYYYVLGFMATLGISLLLYFKYRRWL